MTLDVFLKPKYNSDSISICASSSLRTSQVLFHLVFAITTFCLDNSKLSNLPQVFVEHLGSAHGHGGPKRIKADFVPEECRCRS